MFGLECWQALNGRNYIDRSEVTSRNLLFRVEHKLSYPYQIIGTSKYIAVTRVHSPLKSTQGKVGGPNLVTYCDRPPIKTQFEW